MKYEDVIQLLQYHRHDLMNHIQLIKGYLSMENTDKAKDKLNGLIHNLDNERRLMDLNLPTFTMWILTFNSSHENMRLLYQLDPIRKPFTVRDDFLFKTANRFIKVVQKYTDETILYNIALKIYDYHDQPFLSFHLEGWIEEQASVLKELNGIGESYTENEENIRFTIQV